MKKIINALYEGLIAWSEAVYQYRQSNHSNYY
jgi:hypothetical protein